MSIPNRDPSGTEQRKTAAARSGETAADTDSGRQENLFGKRFSEKEQKQLFLYLVIGIVLAELAVTVGAVIHSITNAQMSADGTPQFRFPWLGYTVSVLVAPALIMLLVHLVSLVFSRPAEGKSDLDGLPGRVRTFYALVHSAPTIILLIAVALIGVGVYYLDGVMALLLKIGDSFQTIAIWLIGGFTAAWIVSYGVRAFLHYKTRQMEAEYAFRHEVLERTGMVLLDTRHAPTTELRLLPGPNGPNTPRALPETSPTPPSNPVEVDAEVAEVAEVAKIAEVIETPVPTGTSATDGRHVAGD